MLILLLVLNLLIVIGLPYISQVSIRSVASISRFLYLELLVCRLKFCAVNHLGGTIFVNQ